MRDLPAISLVIGGASSGKSRFAEALVLATNRPRIYVATAQAFDAEMRKKISDHQSDRSEAGWTTVEDHLTPWKAIEARAPQDIVLLDCATMWLNNLIMAESDIDDNFARLSAGLRNAPCPVVVVSNEVGMGIVPENALARRFRQLQGQLNAELAQDADFVVQVIAGLPQVLKGQLPKGTE